MKLPRTCPSCGGALRVERLRCSGCGCSLEGSFLSCRICALPEQERDLLDALLRARGNAKALQREMGVSYPTVRARLERLWACLNGDDAGAGEADETGEAVVGEGKRGRADPVTAVAAEAPPRADPAAAVLADLREGRITAAIAAERLRAGSGGPGPSQPGLSRPGPDQPGASQPGPDQPGPGRSVQGGPGRDRGIA